MVMCVFPTEKIDGFDSPLQHREFVQVLEGCVAAGIATEVEVDMAYDGGGDTVGGRWFMDVATGRIWRLVVPGGVVDGVWEQVHVA